MKTFKSRIGLYIYNFIVEIAHIDEIKLLLGTDETG